MDTVAAPFRLRIVKSDDTGRVGQEIALTGRATIGREAGCAVLVDEPTVSRRHATVETRDNGFVLTDLQSGNGVWVGERRVNDAVLKIGEHFRVGSTVFECLATGEPEVTPEDRTIVVPRPVLGGPPNIVPTTVERIVLRVVTAAGGFSAGAEVTIDAKVGVVGRSSDCALVVDERDVSRRHAELSLIPGGLLVTDLGSSGGTWVGDRQVSAEVVRPGGRIRLGARAEFEFVDPDRAGAAIVAKADPGAVLPPPPAAAAAAGSAIAPPPVANTPAARAIDPAEPVPMLSPSAPSTPPPAPSAVRESSTRPPTKLPAVPAAAPAAPAPPRPAATTPKMPTPPPPAGSSMPAAEGSPSQFLRAFNREAVHEDGATAMLPASDADFARTIFMPAASVQVPAPQGLDSEGELIKVSAHAPFLLDDPSVCYFVVTGGILIFTVPLEKGQPNGIRTHFLGLLPGQLLFGFDLNAHATGFLAVARPETTLRKIPLAKVMEVASRPSQAAAVAALIDTWVTGLSKSLVRDFNPRPGTDIKLSAGQTVTLKAEEHATTSDGVLWIDIVSRGVLFDAIATPDFARRSAPFPITPHSWIQPSSADFGDTVVRPADTATLVRHPDLWFGLAVFHEVVCEIEFLSKKLAALDEYERQLEKARHQQAAERAAYDAIGAVIKGAGDTPRQFMESAAAEPVLRACQLVGHALGIPIRQHPTADEDGLSYDERVNAVASASGFRTRMVALREEWWTRDHGPMLAMVESTRDPVALLPKGPRAFTYVNPKTGASGPVGPELAATLAPFAHTFYRPFPPGPVSVSALVRFGAVGVAGDLRMVGMMAVVVGLFGTITPRITGQIFDAAIPQAERGMLISFGLALVGSALASAVFKLVQGFATVRLQSKMEYAIQSAVWDRLLNLPTAFFRKYSAGDLSDRAAGVDAIQGLISGAGVAAILGSVSGLFYVAQMFMYSLRMAAAAVVLTLIFVLVNWIGNYLRLNNERQEMSIRGRLSGLVLNLISGVNKLRICGAENHAFRIWAQQFANQKSIGLKSGKVQAAMSVFSAVFPVVSSIVLFVVMTWDMAAAVENNAKPMTTGEFIAFNAAYGAFLAAMQALGDASMSLLRIVPIYERIKPILENEPEVDPSRGFPGRLTGDISISHVSFRYSEDGPYILRDLSLHIKAGEMVAFVGGSGCGKSTLMRLMLGFEKPSTGAILYDGQDMSSIDLRLLRQQMGVVLQQSRVMPTEIYRNITGTSSRTIEDAWAAAEAAGLAEDVRNMPMGMHTYVSEGGGTLSGGQRQRLLIARAIVNKPNILFLDEATSALDNRAQAMVTESMNKMKATRIVIAHRLSTIIDADKICYLDGGKVAEMGTYAELMAKNGLFAELARRQEA